MRSSLLFPACYLKVKCRKNDYDNRWDDPVESMLEEWQKKLLERGG